MSTTAPSDRLAPPVLPVIDAVPRLAGFALTALGLVGTPLLLINRFRPCPVLLGTALVLVLLELLWRRRAQRAGQATRRTAIVSVLALLLAGGFAVGNGRYDSQHLLVDGDPAVYAVSGQLLADTGSIALDTQANEIFGGASHLNYAGTGFDANADEDEVRPGFMHLFPETLAVASWIGGPSWLLRTNAMLAGLALLAVFACGARLIGPVWALVATTGLALLLPEQHFSRDTFSEIPSQLLLFAGLTLLIDVVRARNRAPADSARRVPAVVPGVVAGLVMGASAIARIDAFVSLMPLGIFLVVLVLAGARRLAVGIGAGLAVCTLVGVLDLILASPTYLHLQASQSRMIVAGVVAVAVAGAVVLVRPGWFLRLWGRTRGPVLGGAAAAAVLLLAAFAWFLRPHVDIGHQVVAGLSPVTSVQKSEGLPIDASRTYDELSLHWLGWYLGPIALALGVIGFALLLRRCLGRPGSQPDSAGPRADLAMLLVLLVVGATTALYLWKPSVSPVQYWATRRFLPLAFPGLLLCAGWCLARLWAAGAGGARAGGTRRNRPQLWWLVRTAAVLGALAILVPPLTYLKGHLRDRDYVPLLAATNAICRGLGPKDAVLLLGSPISNSLPQTVQAVCKVPVAVIDNTTTHADLAVAYRAAEAAGKRLVYLSPVDHQRIADGIIDGDYSQVVHEVVSVEALSLTRRPTDRYAFPLSVWLAVAPAPAG